MRLLGLFSTLIFLAYGQTPLFAGTKPEKPADESEDSDSMELVPLVNLDAPLVMIWTSENDDVSIDDATAIDSQLFKDMSARSDIRIYSREKTLRIVDESGDKRLMHCKWEDACLVGIGKLAKASMVMGVKLSGTREQYFLAFKLIRIGDKPSKMMKIISGQLNTLLVGGISKALDSVIKAKATPLKSLPALPPKKAQAPLPAKKKLRASSNEQASHLSANELAASSQPSVIEPPQAPRVQIVAPRPKDEVQTRPEPPGFFRLHLGSAITTGLGIALAGAAIGFGAQASNAQDKVEFQWDPAMDDSGRADALTANILFGLAGVATITAVVLFIIEPSEEDYNLSAKSNGSVAVLRF